jgi:hypothetical protein
MLWGLALRNSQASAVPLVLKGCVVAKENPPALLFRFSYWVPDLQGYCWGTSRKQKASILLSHALDSGKTVIIF